MKIEIFNPQVCALQPKLAHQERSIFMKMALSNIVGWNENTTASACGTACGAGDKTEEKPAACGSACGAGDKTEEKPAACGSACGAGDKTEEKPAACGSACGAGDK